MSAISRIALVIGVAAAIAGCSASLATQEKGAVAGRPPGGTAMPSGEQRLAEPLPMRVVYASPPPVVAQSPRYIWVPDWGVYLLEGQDIVYSDGYHFYFYENHWYVARSCAGPWALIASPPATLAAVPPGHFHKSLPPGLAKTDAVPAGLMH